MPATGITYRDAAEDWGNPGILAVRERCGALGRVLSEDLRVRGDQRVRLARLRDERGRAAGVAVVQERRLARGLVAARRRRPTAYRICDRGGGAGALGSVAGGERDRDRREARLGAGRR